MDAFPNLPQLDCKSERGGRGEENNGDELTKNLINKRNYTLIPSRSANKYVLFKPLDGPGSSVGIATELRAGRSGI